MGNASRFHHACAVAALAVLSAGCASTIMKGYIGQPLQAAMVDYGPPANAFDMGDGRRAFQWSKRSTSTMPTYVTNSGAATPVGNAVWWTQNTQIMGGGTVTSECLYTLYTRWDDTAKSWRVEGFEKPRYACE